MTAPGVVALLISLAISHPPQTPAPSPSVQPPRLTLAMTLRVQVGPPMEMGQVPRGRRRIIPILGGTFEGPAIRGKVLPGCSTRWADGPSTRSRGSTCCRRGITA